LRRRKRRKRRRRRRRRRRMKGELSEYTWRSTCGFVVDTVAFQSSICGVIVGTVPLYRVCSNSLR